MLLRASIAGGLQWTGGEEEEEGDAGLVSPSPTAEAASLLSVLRKEKAIKLDVKFQSRRKRSAVIHERQINADLEPLLTFVFFSFGIAPLDVDEALLFVFLFYPLKLQLFLQDCLFSTLLAEERKEKDKSVTAVNRDESSKRQNAATHFLLTTHAHISTQQREKHSPS